MYSFQRTNDSLPVVLWNIQAHFEYAAIVFGQRWLPPSSSILVSCFTDHTFVNEILACVRDFWKTLADTLKSCLTLMSILPWAAGVIFNRAATYRQTALCFFMGQGSFNQHSLSHWLDAVLDCSWFRLPLEEFITLEFTFFSTLHCESFTRCVQ